MKHDVADKIFFDNDERYADLINGILCNGKQVLKKEDLQEHSGSVQVRMPRSGVRSVQGYGKREKVQDLVRKAALGVNFILIGLENQQTVDYSLPLRCMEYETGQYEKQAQKIRRMVRKHPKGLKTGEYLYGFQRDSRLYPSIILVLYYGKEDWDGPVDLHGLLDFTDIPEEFRRLIQNYRIHLIEVRKLENTDVFRTDVKQVFDLIRYSNDKEKLHSMVTGDSRYQEMEEDAYDMVAVHTGIEEGMKMKVSEGKRVNLCKGLRDLLEDERQEGMMKGRQEGRLEGRLEGHQEGRLEGIKEEQIRQVAKKGKRGQTLEQIADALEKTPEELENVYRSVVASAPDYLVDEIYRKLTKEEGL